MSSDTQSAFVSIFDEMLTYLDVEHQFMCEVPASSLNFNADYNVIVGASGESEGNFMFGCTRNTILAIAGKLMGTKNQTDVDIYVKSAVADFFNDFSKRVLKSAKLKNVFLSSPTYIAGNNLKSMISKVPTINLFFRIEGEKFDISYNIQGA